MIELGIQERSAISALQWLPVEGIRAQYAEYDSVTFQPVFVDFSLRSGYSIRI